MTHDDDGPNWFNPAAAAWPVTKPQPLLATRPAARGWVDDFMFAGEMRAPAPVKSRLWLDILEFYLPFVLLVLVLGAGMWAFIYGWPQMPFFN